MLAQILAQQGARPATAVAVAPQPASYALPPATSAVLRTTDGVIDGRPDLFGSVALKVGRTPLDWRWRSVEDSPVTGAPAAYARSLRELDPAAKAGLINRYVNRHVRYTEDIVQYGKADYWAPADQTLRRGRGDCEDYAIAKLQMLREAGVSPRDLYLVLVNDLVRRADHAVLVMRAGNRMLLLDDGADQVLETQSVSDYRPILTFASYGTWTHGYMRPNPAMQVAQAATAQPVVPAADQRSVNASLLALNTGFKR
jgi:predicted transglutaminase-like cysteine proteinase